MPKKLITENDILEALKKGVTELYVAAGTLITPLAQDRIKHSKLKISPVKNDQVPTASPAASGFAVGADHTGLDIKNMMVEYLKKKGFSVSDVGTFTKDAVDYPDIALKVASKVASGEAAYGILVDATGIPSAISANKVPGIRAATCYNEFSARSSKEHNNANVLVVGARALGEETIKSILEVWLSSEFLGDRHQKRLDKIKNIEKLFSK